MKKLLTVLAAVVVSATMAHAQIGIFAGYTSSATNAQGALESVKSASLWHAGVAYKMDFGPLTVQPALAYSMKGTTISDKENFVDAIEYKTGYVEASVGLQLGLDLMVARPFVVAEPFIGYQVYGNETWENRKDVLNKLEYGFGVGVGADFLQNFQVKIQWFKNLGALATADAHVIEETVKNGNYQGIKISVGFFF